jgi:uncharacterized protein YndB with AHSA1/START domain
MAPLTVHKEILIHAPPEIVWKVQTDIDAWSRWQSGISSARTFSPVAATSTFEWKSGGLTIRSEVQSFEPTRRISWTGVALGTRAMHTWTFSAEQGGTLVTTDESMTGWLVSLLERLTPTFLDKSLDVWLRDLKTTCETLAKSAG